MQIGLPIWMEECNQSPQPTNTPRISNRRRVAQGEAIWGEARAVYTNQWSFQYLNECVFFLSLAWKDWRDGVALYIKILILKTKVWGDPGEGVDTSICVKGSQSYAHRSSSVHDVRLMRKISVARRVLPESARRYELRSTMVAYVNLRNAGKSIHFEEKKHECVWSTDDFGSNLIRTAIDSET